MGPTAPHDQLEAQGLALATAYDLALRACVEARSAKPPDPDCRRLFIALLAAEGDLLDHMAGHGPVETDAGIYKIDGAGFLTYRRRACND